MLGYNYSNGSIVSVDMDIVGVMAAYLPVACVCTTSLDCAGATGATGKYSYAAITPCPYQWTR